MQTIPTTQPERAELLTRLAQHFAVRLEHDLPSGVTLADIDRINPTLPQGACASHDYIDSNETMADTLMQELELGEDIDFNDDNLIALWNEVWHLAKHGGFVLFAASMDSNKRQDLEDSWIYTPVEIVDMAAFAAPPQPSPLPKDVHDLLIKLHNVVEEEHAQEIRTVMLAHGSVMGIKI